MVYIHTHTHTLAAHGLLFMVAAVVMWLTDWVGKIRMARELMAPSGIRYANQDIALNTGMILKEMLRYEPLARILLYSDQ